MHALSGIRTHDGAHIIKHRDNFAVTFTVSNKLIKLKVVSAHKVPLDLSNSGAGDGWIVKCRTES
jgi:hypothetical protein